MTQLPPGVEAGSADLQAALPADEGHSVSGAARQLHCTEANALLAIECKADLGGLPAVVTVTKPEATIVIATESQDAAADCERHGVEVAC